MGTSKLKPQGWWSRRHPTREAQDAAREAYKAEHGRDARRRKAQERLAPKAEPQGEPEAVEDGIGEVSWQPF